MTDPRNDMKPLAPIVRDQRAAPEAGFTASDVILRDLMRYSPLLRPMRPCLTMEQARWLAPRFGSAFRHRTGADVMETLDQMPLIARDARNAAPHPSALAEIAEWNILIRAARRDSLECAWIMTISGETMEAAIRRGFTVLCGIQENRRQPSIISAPLDLPRRCPRRSNHDVLCGTLAGRMHRTPTLPIRQ